MELTFQLKFFFALQSLVTIGKQLSFLHDSLEIKNYLENFKDIQKCKLFSLSTVNHLEHHFVCRPLESVQQSYSQTYCCTEMFRVFLRQPQQAEIIHWQCILYLPCFSYWQLSFPGDSLLHLYIFLRDSKAQVSLMWQWLLSDQWKLCRVQIFLLTFRSGEQKSHKILCSVSISAKSQELSGFRNSNWESRREYLAVAGSTCTVCSCYF